MTTVFETQLRDTAAWLQKHLGRSVLPTKAIILGSGFRGLETVLSGAAAVDFADIPHMPVPSVSGHGAQLVAGSLDGTPVWVLTGRVHLYEGYSPSQVVYPVRALAELGVRHLLITNASGSVNPDLRPGSLVCIRDHINFTGQNCLVGPEARSLGPLFMDMSAAYNPDWSRSILGLEGAGIRTGIYAGVLGPSYETPAETKMLRAMGADIVGMSTVMEVIAARQRGLVIAGLSLVTNMAGGLTSGALHHEEVVAAGHAQKDRLYDVVSKSMGVLP